MEIKTPAVFFRSAKFLFLLSFLVLPFLNPPQLLAQDSETNASPSQDSETSASPSQDSETRPAPRFALRATILSGIEAEFFTGNIGVLINQYAVQTVDCNLSETRIVGRFFNENLAGWYVGLQYYTIDAGACILTIPASGMAFAAGYHWLLKSGISLDLGLRPSLFAFGMAF